MGNVFHGIPPKLALRLAKKHGLNVFVETGTFHGRTTEWAMKHFREVFTIEAHEPYFKKQQQRLGGRNVNFALADSSKFLPAFIPDEPALFWLDAHWSPDLDSEKPDVVCPVLAEIRHINKSPVDHVIMIDDARLFGEAKGFPLMSEVIELLSDNGRRAVFVKQDVIIGEPV